MILACHQPQYLAWPGYYHKMARCDVFVYLDEVQYKRREFQNRNRIKTPQGWRWLTVPVRTAGRGRQRIRDVETLIEAGWAADHLRTLELCYGKAAAFRRHEGFLRRLYGRGWPRLMGICLEWDGYLRAELGIAPRVVLESQEGSEGRGTRRIISLCRRLGCDEYLSGPGGRDYLDEDSLRASGIRLRYQAFGPEPYPQRFGPFVPGLSMADMLLNCGAQAARRAVAAEGGGGAAEGSAAADGRPREAVLSAGP